MSPVQQVKIRKMVYIFIISTFAISWGIDFLLPIDYVDLTMFIPAIIAIVLTVFSQDKFKELFKWGSVQNVLQGFIISCLVFSLFLVLASGFSLATFGLPEAAIKYNNGSSAKALFRFFIFGFPYIFLINLLFSVSEEIGWRGYFLKKLGDKLSNFWFKSLVAGVLWGVWHLPIYIRMGTSIKNILIFILNVCLISIIYTWLFERKFSIWGVAIAHGLHNTLFNIVLPSITLASTSNPLIFGEEGFLITASYGLIIILGIFLLKHFNRSEGSKYAC